MLENFTPKLREIAEVGIKQKEWWSVKMYWALSQRVWTGARPATAASPDNSEYQEPARTCGEVLWGRATSLPAAADWPLGQSGAASRSHIHHLPTCSTLLHAHGDIITFSISLHETSPVKSKSDMKNNNSGPWAEQQQRSRKVILPMKIHTQSISHQWVYCNFCYCSRGRWIKLTLGL